MSTHRLYIYILKRHLEDENIFFYDILPKNILRVFLELKVMSLKSFLKEEVILVVFCIGVDKQTFWGCLITLTKSDVSFKYNFCYNTKLY